MGRMKYIALALALIGCGDEMGVPLPGSCGFWEAQERIAAPAGACVWVGAVDAAARADEECPSSADACAIAIGETMVVTWLDETTDGVAVELTYPLDENGACLVSCEWDGPCVDYRGACAPCPSGATLVIEGEPVECPAE